MSGIEVVGLVSGILTILETIGKLSDALKNAKDLPPAFREVADKLPIVRDILQAVEKHLSTSADQGADEAIKAVLKHCREKAEKLEKLFKAVEPSEDSSSFKRYALMVRSLGKGNRVEVLSKGMMEDVKLLVQNHAAQAATEAQVAKLSEAIRVMSSMEISLPEEEAISQTHYGSGDNVAGNKYAGNHNENSGSGTAYFAPVTQHVHSRPPRKLSLSEHLIRSLSFKEMNTRPIEIKIEAAGTCRWIFQHKVYKTWESCDRSLLWIKGKPGSGKSTLLRYVLDNTIASKSRKEMPLVLSFFFNGRGTELQKTPDGLYRSLLCQLQSKIPEALEAMEITIKQRYTPLATSDEPWEWKTSELRHYTQIAFWRTLEIHPIILFVDALDECGQKSAEELADEFNSLLHRPLSDRLKYFRICFTCRHYPILNLNCTLRICIDTENAKDISLFVENKLSSFQEQTGSKIADYISKHAEGVFLWASLVVTRVMSLYQEQIGILKIESEVRQIPQTLEKLYSEIIDRIEQDSIDLIECICFAARPLTLLELYSAVSLAHQEFKSLLEFENEEEFRIHAAAMEWRITKLGRGLVEYKPTEGIVQFIHQSVKDFFVDKGLPSLHKSTDTEQTAISAHYRLTQICVRYLEMLHDHLTANEDQWRKPKWDSKFPFLSYAKRLWIFHANHIPDNLQESFRWPSDASLGRLGRTTLKFENWVQYMTYNPIQTRIIHIISRNGWIGALKGILTRADEDGVKVDLEVQDYWGDTPLAIAASSGHVAVVKSLLDNGAKQHQKNLYGQTPLHYAVQHGDIGLIELFLETGAWRDRDVLDMYGYTPLSYAVENGNIAAIELLLKIGSRVDNNYIVEGMCRSRSIYSGKWLAYSGRVLYSSINVLVNLTALLGLVGATIVWLGIGKWACVEAVVYPGVARTVWRSRTRKPTESWRTPLSHAADLGNQAAVRLLLEYNARPEDKDKDGETPLSRAEKNDRKEVMQILRDSMGQG
ncbi:related to ankyrin 3 [Fusarium fujikuroi]|nr:related to ankyrin 3 [Fusarium fujikuroi]SCO31149.1 related to ankyrin 3 [Fusarium fujikuroi]